MPVGAVCLGLLALYMKIVLCCLYTHTCRAIFVLLQWDLASIAPWGIVLLLSLALIETYRMATLWGEEDVDKRVYPGNQ